MSKSDIHELQEVCATLYAVSLESDKPIITGNHTHTHL